MTSKRLLTPVAKCLFAAADYIEKNGLWKHDFFEDERDPASPACIEGAIERAVFGMGETNAYDCWRTTIGILTDKLNRPIPVWNDAPRRTAKQVVAKLRKIAMECSV